MSDLLAALSGAIERARLAQPTPDQSYCDVHKHALCSGYTEDESDAETCMCECHDEAAT